MNAQSDRGTDVELMLPSQPSSAHPTADLPSTGCAAPPRRPALRKRLGSSHGATPPLDAAATTPRINPSRYVTVELFSAITGLSQGAVRKRIERGVYLEGKQYRRAPDGRVWMDTRGHEQWVEAVTA
jgi:hypothetical protein